MFRIKRILPIVSVAPVDVVSDGVVIPTVTTVVVSPAVSVVPSGLLYYPGSISDALASELLAWLTSPETTGWFSVGGANSRRVMHFGYSYDYRSGSVTDAATSMPDILERLRSIIGSTIDVPCGYIFDQCIINRYEPRQGISAHIDRQPQYGRIVACFTISSGAEMEFTHPTVPTYRLYVDPGSLYVMTGDSRTVWRHAMRGRLTDPGHGARGIRYSITFRSVTK